MPGEVPEGWAVVRLSQIAELSLGKMLDKDKNRGEMRPYLANINVRWGSFDLRNLREMRFEDREIERYGLRYGDIVMCEGGEPGRCAIWLEDDAGMMIQKALHRIRPSDGIDAHYLYFALAQKGSSGAFAEYLTGGGIKHLPGEQLAKVEVPIPPLDEQLRIAEVLKAADSVLYIGQQTIERLIALRAQARASLFDSPEARWPRRRVGEIASLSGGTTPSRGNEAYWNDAAVPWATPSDITALPEGENRLRATKNRISNLALKECSLTLCPPGTVLMTSRATIGYAAINDVSTTTNQGFLNFTCSPDCDPEFLCQWLNANRASLTAAAGGSTFKELSRNTAKLLPISLPPLKEQQEIAETLRAIDASLLSAGRAVEKAGAVRASVGDGLISGVVRVPA